MNLARCAAALLAVALAAAGCSSSAAPHKSSAASSTPPVSTMPSSAPVSSPTPTPTKTTPLSPFEQDPAVVAFRSWAAQVARTINERKIDEPALDALMTASFAKGIRGITSGEIGHRYPGPVPFTPTRVTVTSSSARDLHLCVIDDGYSLNPKTGKPFAARHVQPIDASAVKFNGRWLVSKFDGASFSCAGVKIPEPSWARS